MDSFTAFSMGEANRHKPLMVFDWDKAARLIRETNTMTASAGLQSDWEWTGGTILRDGQPVPEEDTYVYLASTWAEPELLLDDMSTIPCWRYQNDTPGWDSGTYWPESARAILSDQPTALAA